MAALVLAPVATAAQETLVAGSLVFHHTPRQEALARRMVERASTDDLPGLPRDVLDGEPVQIWLAPDRAAWDSITGGAVPEWGAGVADPAAGVIVLPTFDWARTGPFDLYATLRHELAHVALYRHLAPSRIPRWFTEGYAQWAAGEWDFEAVWRLRLAFVRQQAPPLDSLTLDWPAGEAQARVAYLLAASAVAYLTRSAGERGIGLMLRRWHETGDFDAALRRTYGVTLGQFEEDWRQDVRERYAWPLFLAHSLVFWAVAAMALLVLFVIRRRRDRARMQRLRETEPPDDPAYWLEMEVPPEGPEGPEGPAG